MPAASTRLDAPPMTPPETSGQMGFSGVGEMLGDKMKQGQPPGDMQGGVQPQGALLAQYSALEKVINQMSTQNEKFAPYGARAIAILKEGLSASISETPNQAEKPVSDIQSPAVGQPGMEGSVGKGFVG